MPVIIQGENVALSVEDAERLWHATKEETGHADDDITVQVVDEMESKRLNLKYRKKDAPTNVLTFSYGDATHDIALCMSVAEREAQERGVALRDYSALLLVHAFLHATGMDHERSDEEATTTHSAELRILKQAGFNAIMLE